MAGYFAFGPQLLYLPEDRQSHANPFLRAGWKVYRTGSQAAFAGMSGSLVAVGVYKVGIGGGTVWHALSRS